MKTVVCIVSDVPLLGESLSMALAQSDLSATHFASLDELFGSQQLRRSAAVISNFTNGGAVERELAHRLFEKFPKVLLFVIASSIHTRGALLGAQENLAAIFDSPCQPEELIAAVIERCIPNRV